MSAEDRARRRAEARRALIGQEDATRKDQRLIQSAAVRAFNTAWDQQEDEIERLRAVIAKADEKLLGMFYGEAHAILSRVPQEATEPWTDPKPWCDESGRRYMEGPSLPGSATWQPRTLEQYDAEEGNRG